jgi:hypothetical protein
MLSGRLIPFAEHSEPQSQVPQRPQMVVQVGRDTELLRLRAQIISSAGYTVHSLAPDEAVEEVGKEREARVWVFCHTLEFYELALLAVAVRSSRPSDKLIRLTGLNDIGHMPGLFDGLLEPVRGVDDLLRTVGELATQSA